VNNRLEGYLWIAGILVFCTVGTHLSLIWRGRLVPSFAGYVDTVGLMGIMIVINIAAGVFPSKQVKGPGRELEGAARLLFIFPLKVLFLMIIPAVLLNDWLRGMLSLGQRAMLYGAFALVSTAGFVIARQRRARLKRDAAAATKANGG
jgi:hypothetical protein